MRRQEKQRIIADVTSQMLMRSRRKANLFSYGELNIVYRRYASLYFAVGVDDEDNVLLHLEKVHLFVEVLDRYFGNVCELDLMYVFTYLFIYLSMCTVLSISMCTVLFI